MNEPSSVKQFVMLAFAVLEFQFTRLKAVYVCGALGLAVVLLAGWFVLLDPAPQFPTGEIITIPQGATLAEVADQLTAEGLIRSPLLFEVLARLRGANAGMKSGKYVFERPVGLFRVEERVQDGAFGIVAERVVIREGETVREIARQLKARFPSFDADGFLNEALPLEGYLFPDTYFFYPDVTPDEVVVKMYANFLDQIASISPQIDAFDRPLTDDLVMASILEDEAKSLTDKRMVAGILYNRLQKGMPLQVDAVFGYIEDKPEFSPSLDDLAIDSPYNTYRNKGLPPGPIGNPGLNAILAAVTPATTTALYYLTGIDGQMHYAVTFAQHKANRAKYLD
ncbi:MAG TPA: endolytic transglycosylase MltG [Candidatus Paceibacterota bacterium]|nr:endolytic transglycosylase MltG [Candidatus Paceibacterota bacterium]